MGFQSVRRLESGSWLFTDLMTIQIPRHNTLSSTRKVFDPLPLYIRILVPISFIFQIDNERNSIIATRLFASAGWILPCDHFTYLGQVKWKLRGQLFGPLIIAPNRNIRGRISHESMKNIILWACDFEYDLDWYWEPRRISTEIDLEFQNCLMQFTRPKLILPSSQLFSPFFIPDCLIVLRKFNFWTRFLAFSKFEIFFRTVLFVTEICFLENQVNSGNY